MKLNWMFSGAAALVVFAAGIFPAGAQPVPAVTSAPVYVPDYTHANEPMADNVIAWDGLLKATDATNGQDFARFVFSFTNIAQKIEVGLATNIISLTNFTTITNSSFWGKKIVPVTSVVFRTNTVPVTNGFAPADVTILSVHPSCGCTTAELPPVPWTIPGGSNGVIKVAVNLAGKSGVVFKSVNVSTDHGSKTLQLRINILPPPPVKPMSDEDRARGIAAAKIDRQAVFKGDCATCHVNKVEGKYGQQLFDAICAVCHEANPRATMVPDLHNLKDPTSEEFWRTWITSGKAGTLMPAFATSQGGPLNDMQIASLAAYLNAVIPSHVPPPAR